MPSICETPFLYLESLPQSTAFAKEKPEFITPIFLVTDVQTHMLKMTLIWK